MNAINWFVNLLPRLAQLWTWLNTPLLDIGDFKLAPIGVISTSALAILLGLALIRGK